jgi:hypothetical protein
VVSIQELRRYRNKEVRMEFIDGLAMHVEIVDVADDQNQDEVAYKVLSVLRPGKAVRPPLKAGEYYTTDLKEIVEVQELEKPHEQ